MNVSTNKWRLCRNPKDLSYMNGSRNKWRLCRNLRTYLACIKSETHEWLRLKPKPILYEWKVETHEDYVETLRTYLACIKSETHKWLRLKPKPNLYEWKEETHKDYVKTKEARLRLLAWICYLNFALMKYRNP